MKPAARLPAFIAIIFVAGAVIGLFFQFYYHKYLNIDTLAYINIAELYAAGKFSLAVNGCWSPLYSWILAVLLLTGIPALAACYVLNFVFAGVCVYYVYAISQKYLTDIRLLALFNLFSVFFFLNQSLSVLTPDLLAAAIGFYFLHLLISPAFFKSRARQITAGVAAGFLFFAKSYNFLFVIAFLLVLCLINIFRRKQEPKKYPAFLFTGCVFLAVSLCWIIPLSVHEGKPTFSTAGNYVYRFMHPDNTDHPSALRIIPPPFREAYSSWINPVHQLDSMAWSPFESKRNFNYQVHLIERSARTTFQIVDKRLIKTSIMLLIGCLAIFKLKLRQQLKQHDLTLLIVAMVVYPLGYFPLFVIDRYIIVSILLYYFFFFYMLQAVLTLLPRKTGWLIFAITILSLVIPGIRYATTAWKQKSFEYSIYRAFYERKEDFQFLKNKRIAATHDSYIFSAQLCYLFETRFYGIWNEAEAEEARKYGVEYVISGAPLSSPALIFHQDIPIGGYMTYVYRVR